MAASTDSDDESLSSDAELQEAYAKGELKPGLNVPTRAPKQFVNNVTGLKEKLESIKQNYAWIERLDVVCEDLPSMTGVEEADLSKSLDEDVHDDFKREMQFYRQAQASVLEAVPRLHKLNIPTKRPDDYFAEMVKSDVHMKKVRENLLNKQLNIERKEKARRLRELRKYGKKVQQDVLHKRQKEKKELMEAVKKFRKGHTNKLDIKDSKRGPNLTIQKGETKNSQQKKTTVQGKNKVNKKREYKNSKFGFGGKKRRAKANTKESYASVKKKKIPGKMKVNVRKASKRPGKARRTKARNISASKK